MTRWLALLLVACGSSSEAAPAAIDSSTAEDGTVEIDTSAVDTATAPDVADASEAASDASDAAETAPPFDIIGDATGECGKLKSFVTTSTWTLIEVPIAFTSSDKYERARLSPGGVRVFDAPNAGGSSKESEVMTFEILHHCDGASLVKTETEIKYGPAPDGGAATITDMTVTIGGTRLGVNPKRVFKPEPLTMTDTEVRDQLVKNFESIKASTARVLPEDGWTKQVLHLWVPNATYYDAVKRVLPMIDDATKGNTIILLTRSTGGGFLYCDPDPALGSECPPIK
jgi:hypothetical protein